MTRWGNWPDDMMAQFEKTKTQQNMTHDGYRDSHKAADKGVSYETFYATDARARYLWAREQKVLSEILNEYYHDRDVHLLDFACGTGRITSFLETHVTTSTGVDVSESMLEVARKRLKRTEIIQADLTHENVLRGRQFNLITTFRFFLNAEDELRRAAIEVLVPLLADGGYLVFNNHRNKTSPLRRAIYYYHRLRGGECKFMSMREARALVEEAGLEIVRVYAVGLLSIPRMPVPDRLHHAADAALGRITCLAASSESPIIVCRRRKGEAPS